MSAEFLVDISSALSQTFDADLSRQWNRLSTLASMVPTIAGHGKNAAFDVEFSGATAGAVSEGSDVDSSEYASDVNVPATLSWAIYRSSFQISEHELDAAAGSMGTPTALMDLFGERIMGCGHKLASTINADMFSATGVNGSGNPTIVGLSQGPLEATGLYAGLSRSTYTEWAGNTLKNGSTPRPLSLDLIYQLEQSIFTASGEVPSMIVTTPAIFRKYAGLFESVRRLSTDGGGPLQYEAGASTLSWKGVPIVRDRNCTAGTLFMLSPQHLQTKYLPRLQSPVDAVTQSMTEASGSNGGGVTTMTGIPARIVVLAKTGDSVKVSLKTTLQMVAKRPNAMGYISDISEV